MLTDYEYLRIMRGLRGTGGYYARCYAAARAAFLSGYSLDAAISKARAKYDF